MFAPRVVGNVAVVETAPNHVNVTGALTFETARIAQAAGLRVIRGAGSADPLQIDCAGVTASDSAGLAVLIDWLANARKVGRGIRYVNLPPGIRAAAGISDVQSLLDS